MIIASAAKFETKPLQAEMAKCAADIGWIFCGVGVLAAAAAGQRAKALCHNQEVLFIGTCGTFGTFKKVELCVPKHCTGHPPVLVLACPMQWIRHHHCRSTPQLATTLCPPRSFLCS